MTIDIDNIDADQIERDDADRAIDAQTDAYAEAAIIEQNRIVGDALASWQVLTVISRGKHAVAEFVRRVLEECGNGSSNAERVEQAILDGNEINPKIADLNKRCALTAASRPTRREIELQAKLNAANGLLDHYICEAQTLRDRLNEKKVA